MTDYKPGDIVNGHVLTSDGRWIPLTPPAPPAPSVPHVVVVQNASATVAGPTAVAVPSTRTGISTGEHVLHAILTLSTFGLWGIVWIIRAVTARGPHTSTIAFPLPAQPQQPLLQQQWNPQHLGQQQPPQWQPQQRVQPPPQPQPRAEHTQVLPEVWPTDGPQDSQVWPPRP
jgi:hypothetical protein